MVWFFRLAVVAAVVLGGGAEAQLLAEAPIAVKPQVEVDARTPNSNQTLLRLDWVLHGLTSPFQLGLARQAYRDEGIEIPPDIETRIEKLTIAA